MSPSYTTQEYVIVIKKIDVIQIHLKYHSTFLFAAMKVPIV